MFVRYLIGMINYLDYNYSKTKGQTQAGHTFASSINMGKSDPYYTSDLVNQEVIATGNGSDTTFNIDLNWSPVRLGTFLVEAGTVYGSDIAAPGTITGTGVSGTITNAGRDSKLALTFNTAPSSGTDIVVTYRFDNESVYSDGFQAAGFTNVPEMELRINSLPIEARARTLRSYWAFDAAYELQKEYGQDIETLLATQATGELAHEIDNELTLDLLNFANAGAPLIWSMVQPTGVSLVDHYDSFNAKLIEGANQIFNATRRVKANFICCGIQVASVIEAMRNFTPSGISAVGPHFLGTLGNYKVFVNPDYPTNEFILGYKGSTMFDAGAFYCPYMPISSTDLIMDANFRGQRGWATMYGKKLLNSKMYIKGSIIG